MIDIPGKMKNDTCNTWRPGKTSTDPWRPRETTGDHERPLETKGDQ